MTPQAASTQPNPLTTRASLAERQAALVAALVAGEAVPDGFDPALVGAARAALLRKRAGEVAAAWPLLAAAYGTEWPAAFGAWAAGRAPGGSLRDGWDFATAAGAALPDLAKDELHERERQFFYDGRSTPRPRPLTALRAFVSRVR
jgi:hypothetical protein